MSENSKITADVFSKPINSFTYVLCGTWYPSNNINNTPREIVLRLRRVCNSNEKFTACSNELKNYITAREYKYKVVEKHFSEISKLWRAEDRKINPKQQDNYRILSVTIYNPMLSNMRSLTKKHLPTLHSDSDFKKILSENFICTTCNRNKNLKEKWSPLLYAKNKNENKS